MQQRQMKLSAVYLFNAMKIYLLFVKYDSWNIPIKIVHRVNFIVSTARIPVGNRQPSVPVTAFERPRKIDLLIVANAHIQRL